jgi:hypothetical protein
VCVSPIDPEIPAPDSMSEVIALYRRDVDLSLLRSRLAMTVDDRLRSLMQMQRVAEEFRRAGRTHREAQA